MPVLANTAGKKMNEYSVLPGIISVVVIEERCTG
jgi:hypothetical protein